MNLNASPVFLLLNPTNNEKYDISKPCTAVKKLWHFWRAIYVPKENTLLAFKYIHTL